MMHDYWVNLNKAFSVSSIMTHRDNWVTIDSNQLTASEIGLLFERYRFDIIPILDNDQIISFYWVTTPNEPQVITKDWIISSDSPIPNLLSIFLRSNKPALFVLSNQDLVGLVTPADLNKIQARSFIYFLIGDLENCLGNYLRSFPEVTDDLIFSSLSPDRKTIIAKIKSNAENENLILNLIEYLSFSELINLLESNPFLYTKMGYKSRTSIHNAFSGIVDLRNDTMHLVKPLITSKFEGLNRLSNRIDRINRLINIFQDINSKSE